MTPQTLALLANVLLLLHFTLVAFVVLGLLFILLGGLLRWSWVRNFWFRLVHLLLVAVIVLESAFGITCPLTTWEVQLRQKAGEVAAIELERQGFIIYYVSKTLFLGDTLDLNAETLMWLYIGFGAVVLASLFLIPPRWPRRRCQSHSLPEPCTTSQV